ncbi:MAG: DUF4349 domain-containing protein [Clostridia bacterium]|nr:DUF4349 domain-containing protein [Clostridia bacterium]
MMDCRTFALLLEKPEEEWTREERQELDAHAAGCRDCAMLLAMRREMRAMDEETEVPAAFSVSWRNVIDMEAQKKMNGKISSFPWKRALAGVAAVAVLAIGTTVTYLDNQSNSYRYTAGKQYASYESSDYDVEPAEYEEAAPMLAASGAVSEKRAVSDSAMYSTTSTADAGAAQAAKVIRTVNFTIQTRDYENDYEAIRQLTADLGGRVESLNSSGDGTSSSLRRANFTLRIPSDRLDEFISGARGVGKVSSFSESSDDVSESYYDTQSRLNTQRVKLERLTELMQKAEDVSDLIELENAISDAQYWIDYYTGSLRGYDSRVSDSYVYVNLREMSSASAAETKELTLGERILNAIGASLETAAEVLQALVIFLVAALPWFAALAVVIVLVRLIVRRRKARKQKKEE